MIILIMLRFISLYLILTQSALANSGTFYSLVFGTAGVFWMIMYVPVEGLIYKLMKVKTPFKVSLKINLFSALIGLLLMIPLAKVGWVESSGSVRYYLLEYGHKREAGFEDMRRRMPDTTAVKDLLGWEPKLPLEKIIEDVADFIKS